MSEQSFQEGMPTVGTRGTDAGAGSDATRPTNDGESGRPQVETAPVAPGFTSDALVGNGESFRARWSSVQVGFVDDPRRAVEEAEQLVTDVIADLVDGFKRRRRELEGDGSGSTDQMRGAFQSYRDFFDRLLNV